MATLKPRITVTLQPDVYETIRDLAEAQGVTMSGLVSEFLTMVNPVQQRVLRATLKAKHLDENSKAKVIQSLEVGEAQFTKVLGPLFELFDKITGGQPPHSNTGVTNTNPKEHTHTKTASKGRSRASASVGEGAKTQKHKNTKTQPAKGATNAA